MNVRLGDYVHCRSGDKGDICNISVIPYDEDDYEWLGTVLTEERVAAAFGELVRGGVTRYDVPGLRSYNLVLRQALGGGVSRSLNLDIHGKAWGVLVAAMEVPR